MGELRLFGAMVGEITNLRDVSVWQRPATYGNGNKVTSGHGGGIYQASGSLYMTGSVVIADNKAEAGNGGGIYSSGGSITADFTTFIRVSANIAQNGGGIYFGASTYQTANFTSLSPNGYLSLGGDKAYYQGGGIYLGYYGTMTIDDIDMYDCSAGGNTSRGQGIGNSSGYGGGIYTSGTLRIGACGIARCHTYTPYWSYNLRGEGMDDGYGGGMYISAGSVNISCDISYCSACDGGGIYQSGGTCRVYSDITDNGCSRYGGGVSQFGGYFYLDWVALIGYNTGANFSGGIVINYNNVNWSGGSRDTWGRIGEY